jgi:hypothetical protein
MDVQAKLNQRMNQKNLALSQQVDLVNIVLEEVALRALRAGVDLDDLEPNIGAEALGLWKLQAEQGTVDTDEDPS